MKHGKNALGDPEVSIRRGLFAGIAAVVIMVGGAGGWASTTQFSGAVVTPGILVVDSSVKKVQHPTGGVVGEIRVRDGDSVAAGSVLARLDETVTRANLAIVQKSLDEFRIRQSRLEAELNGDLTFAVPDNLEGNRSDPETDRTIRTEKRVFETRKLSREGQRSQLLERIGQLREQMLGLNEQVVSKGREIELIGEELAGVRELFQKKLISLQRVTALERDSARLRGERGSLISSIAQSKGRITEIELQIMQIHQDLRTEVGKEISTVQSKIAELVERKVGAEDQLKRIDIRAPQSGRVHQLAVHTVGGVIGPAETIMMIVPESDKLAVECKINPRDIDQVRQARTARLRFSAFDQRTTPEIDGTLALVSADLSTDPRTGASYYTARIMISAEEIARLENLKLVPGMPVEAFIQTSERTVISYFTKPLADQVERAFREGR